MSLSFFGSLEPGVTVPVGTLNSRRCWPLLSIVAAEVKGREREREMAADVLARADKAWLGRLITRRVPLDRWSEALEYRHGDIKVIIDFVQ